MAFQTPQQLPLNQPPVFENQQPFIQPLLMLPPVPPLLQQQNPPVMQQQPSPVLQPPNTPMLQQQSPVMMQQSPSLVQPPQPQSPLQPLAQQPFLAPSRVPPTLAGIPEDVVQAWNDVVMPAPPAPPALASEEIAIRFLQPEVPIVVLPEVTSGTPTPKPKERKSKTTKPKVKQQQPFKAKFEAGPLYYEVALSDMVLMPSTNTYYEMGTLLSLKNDRPWNHETNTGMADADWHRLVEFTRLQEVTALCAKHLLKRNTSIAEARVMGDYNLETVLRREYTLACSQASRTVDRNYTDPRPQGSRVDKISESYTSLIPERFTPNVDIQVQYVPHKFVDGDLPLDLRAISSKIHPDDHYLHDLAGSHGLERLFEIPSDNPQFVYFACDLITKQPLQRDWRSAVWFPSALHVLAFSERAKFLGLQTSITQAIYNNPAMLQNQTDILNELLDWVNNNFDSFCRLFYIKRHQIHILRELKNNWAQKKPNPGKTTYHGLTFPLESDRQGKIIDAFLYNSYLIQPADVEEPQLGVLIPVLGYQLVSNVKDIGRLSGSSLFTQVGEWTRYRFSHADFEIGLQRHIAYDRLPGLGNMEQKKAHPEILKIVHRNLDLYDLRLSDGGTAMRAVWNNAQKHPNSGCVDLNLISFPLGICYYDHWDATIQEMHRGRGLAFCRIPRWGWQKAGSFMHHNSWSIYDEYNNSNPNPTPEMVSLKPSPAKKAKQVLKTKPVASTSYASTVSTPATASKIKRATPLMDLPITGSLAAREADVDHTNDFPELSPEEYARNSFVEETPEQKVNWKALNKYLNKEDHVMPKVWPGPPGHENDRPLILNHKWTCWSVRHSDLGFLQPGEPHSWRAKPCLIVKLKDIGYPALIDRCANDPLFQDTYDSLITIPAWEGMVAAGCIPIYPLRTINEQWVKCSVPLCCARGEYRPDKHRVIMSPWGVTTPAPIHPDAEMPPLPRYMCFDVSKRAYKFYNWKESLHDLMDPMIYQHLQYKPYYQCPMEPCVSEPYRSRPADMLLDPRHHNGEPPGQDSSWYKHQYVLQTPLRVVHDCLLEGTKEEVRQTYHDLTGGANPISVSYTPQAASGAPASRQASWDSLSSDSVPSAAR
jgi:hypothetical protein